MSFFIVLSCTGSDVPDGDQSPVISPVENVYELLEPIPFPFSSTTFIYILLVYDVLLHVTVNTEKLSVTNSAFLTFIADVVSTVAVSFSSATISTTSLTSPFSSSSRCITVTSKFWSSFSVRTFFASSGISACLYFMETFTSPFGSSLFPFASAKVMS